MEDSLLETGLESQDVPKRFVICWKLSNTTKRGSKRLEYRKRLAVAVLTTILVLLPTTFTYIRIRNRQLENDVSNLTRPHVIFIVADDLGWNDVGWNNKKIKSPNLDNLAKAGVMLDHYYTYPICTPSRAAILTGYYSHRIGLQQRVIHDFQKRFVPKDIPMISERFQELGYSTNMVGKWHLGHCNWDYTPTHRGFDSFFGYNFATLSYYTHTWRKLYDLWENRSPYLDPEKTYSTDLFSKRSLTVIENHAQLHGNRKPLFLYLAFQAIHGPAEEVPEKYQIETPFKNVKSREIAARAVKAMDEAIGNLISSLERNNLMKNALVAFVSDNGGEISNGGNNLPFRGGKFTLWEGGARVPAFVYGPMLSNPGRVHSGLFHAVDWFPTLLSAVKAPPETGVPRYDGIDQWDLLRNGSNQEVSLRYDIVYGIDTSRNAAIRVGDYKIIQGNPVGEAYEKIMKDSKSPFDANGWPQGDKPGSGRSRDTFTDESVLLFNLRQDPEERVNLADKMPEMVERMRERLNTEISRAVPEQDRIRYRDEAMNKVRNDVLYPGWC
ncbi:arylsulfatase B-like [Lineus longissimus]|uniref:arylsulfatase B-like n=1 Tax=Lineus longissimus TaxID=88925 RepID=UPI00315CDFB6